MRGDFLTDLLGLLGPLQSYPILLINITKVQVYMDRCMSVTHSHKNQERVWMWTQMVYNQRP